MENLGHIASSVRRRENKGSRLPMGSASQWCNHVHSQLIVYILFLWPCLTAKGMGNEGKKWFIWWPLYLCFSLPFCPPNSPLLPSFPTWNLSSREIAQSSIPSMHSVRRCISGLYVVMFPSDQDITLLGLETCELKMQINSLPHSDIIIKLVPNNCKNHCPLEEGRMSDIQWCSLIYRETENIILWEAVMLTTYSICSFILLHIQRCLSHYPFCNPTEKAL